MSTFSSFRSVAFEFLQYDSRRRLPSSWLSRSLCPRTSQAPFSPLLQPHTQHRSFHFSHPRRKWTKNNQVSKTNNEQHLAKERKRKEIGLRDTQIPYNKVQVVSRAGLSPYQPLSDVLAEVERLNIMENKKRYHAQLIGNEQGPMVKIIDMKEEYEKTKAAQEQAKANAAQKVHKEVQLTWRSDEADVKTKLEKMRKDLEKGCRVDVVVTPKKGVRAPHPEEMQKRAQEIVAQFEGVGKEWKELTFNRGSIVIYLQGIAVPATPGPGEAEGEKIPKRVQVKLERKERAAKRIEEKKQREDELFAQSQLGNEPSL